MVRKIIPSRKHEILATQSEPDAVAHHEALVRELIEQARTGGSRERKEFERELKSWKAKRFGELRQI